jgi:DNA polymerase-3 subunit delta
MKRSLSSDALKSQSDFNRQLQSGQIEPLYLLEGAETYLRDEALKRLIKAAVDEAVWEFNVTTISVGQGNLDVALAHARQMPLISPRRVMVVKDFEAINDERQLEVLKDYLRTPVATTALVFVSAALDKRRNIASMLQKTCAVVSFAPLDEREAAPRWVADYVARAGCFIEQAAAAYLVGMVGTDVRRLTHELDKALAYVGGKGQITKDEFNELVRYSREHSNFELTDVILEGDRKRALTLLDHLFANPAEPPQTLSLLILGAIASNYRKILAVKELMRQNASAEEVAKAVGLPYFLVGQFNERARRIETAQILRGIARIAATDVALKSSLATPRLQLELLICELCPPERERRQGFHR